VLLSIFQDLYSFTNHTQANTPNITVKPSGIPQVSRPTATPGTLGKKVYCTYFLNTGNCNYMQEGCKYKHEFPEDEETRSAIGLRKLPTWMRDDPAVPIKPIPAAFSANTWRRPGSQPPQAELSVGAKPSPQNPFSSSANNGRRFTQPQNGTRSNSPAVLPPAAQAAQASFMQPQNSNYNNHAQQVPFFGPPQHHFPSHASHNTQQQSRPISGKFVNSNGNGHGHNSPAVISAHSFSRQIPTNGTNSSYHQPTASVMQPRGSSPPTQAPIGRPASNSQSSAPNAHVDGQQQTRGRTDDQHRPHYNGHTAPDALLRNAVVYTPSTTANSHHATNGSTTSLANGNGNASGNSTHNNPPGHHFAGSHAIRYAESNGDGSLSSDGNHNAQGHYLAGLHSNGNAATNGNGSATAPHYSRAPIPMSVSSHRTYTGAAQDNQSTTSNMPANIDGNAPATSNGPLPLMSNDIHQLTLNTQPLTPSTFTKDNGNGNGNGIDNHNAGYASQSDISQVAPGSPAYMHKRMFIKEGEQRYVEAPMKEVQGSEAEEVHTKGRGFKKHGAGSNKSRHHGSKGGHGKHAQATLFEPLI